MFGLAFMLVSAQTVKGTYTKVGFSLQSYDFPAFLVSPSITTTTLEDGRKEIRFQYSQPVVTADHNICLEVYFDAIEGGSKFDHAVVAPLGAYTYKSSPHLAPGDAGVIETENYTKVGKAEVQVDGSLVLLRYHPVNVNNAPYNAILFRYLPNTIPMTNLADEFNSVRPKRLFLSSEFNGAFNQDPFKVPSRKADDLVNPLVKNARKN